MKNKIFYILIIVLFSFSSKVLASELCSPKGYSIFTVNGIFTDEHGADVNRRALERKLLSPYKGEKLTVDFLYNPTHLAGVGDLIDVVQQGLFEQKSDYDLVEMLRDASQKVTTQKLLLVAHSQGNFYANNFYDKTASQQGGVPEESIGVYSVATPANHVAGGGKYLTSDTDSVITATAGRYFKILPANIHIPLQSVDGNGHSFSDVYLKYQGDKIVADIKSSLDKLKENDEQEVQDPCISPPELTLFHKTQGVALVSADFVIDNTRKGIAYLANGIYDMSLAIRNVFTNLFATAVESLPDVNSITTVPIDIAETTEEIPSLIPPLTSLPTEKENENATNDVLQPTLPPIVPSIPPIIPGASSHGNGTGSRTPVVQPENNSLPEENIPPEVPPVIPPVESPIIPPEEPPIIPPVIPPVIPPDPIIQPDPIIIPPVLDIIPPVITLNGNAFEVIIKNSIYTDAGATALDDIDGATNVITTGISDVDTTVVGNYIITYTATDIAGNISTATRTVKVATNQYIPKNSFGKNNGDGNDWQVWSFNGSNIYNWTNTYVDNYLREQFKIQANAGAWCSQCLQIGIFKNDPQKGFEPSDLFYLTGMNGSPQNNQDDIIYDIVIQWDSTGYTYTTSNGSSVFATGHTDIANINNDSWVGWDGSFNNFQTFPSGSWQGIIPSSPLNRTGGSGMILQPYPIYKNQLVPVIPTLSFPNKGLYAGVGINPTRGRTNLTPFTFQIIYTDGNNNAPQNVKLHVVNTTTGASISEMEMQKILPSADALSDGSFANGELYITNDIFYDTGEYNYYFTANDNAGNLIRIPEDDVLNFGVISSTYTYIPKYSFGMNNGDGNDWQVWSFNGSNIYDWSDTYVNNYLKEQFKIQAYKGFWCSQCLQRGIFNHNPQKGFEQTDFITSALENNPQNNQNDVIYDVTILWDSAGYTYTISHDGISDASAHIDITNVNENMWVGWDVSNNNFRTFPSGSWQGVAPFLSLNRTGGSDLILQPYPVYDPSQVSTDPIPPIPEPIPDPVPDPIPDPISDPDPVPDSTAPSITSYTFNGVASDITINPLINPISLVFSASENVDWVSIKIENKDNTSIYKIFQSGTNCVDGTNICTKNWDGLLSGGSEAQNGTFRIKMHIKDPANNEFYDYLLPYVINVNTAI